MSNHFQKDIKVYPLAELIEVNDEKELREYKVKELKFKPRRRRDNIKLSPEEMKELEALEDKGGKSKINDVK